MHFINIRLYKSTHLGGRGGFCPGGNIVMILFLITSSYPSQLTVEKAIKSDHLANYLDLTFIIESAGKLSIRLYEKRDDLTPM